MTEPPKEFREWDRHQWAGDNAEGVSDTAANDAQAEPAAETRWTKAEWVGEDASGHRPARQPPDDMPEGEPGLSGSRHNPGVQHWVSVEPATENPDN
jgi:hypothetical protein